jgi:hypothetical protein
MNPAALVAVSLATGAANAGAKPTV